MLAKRLMWFVTRHKLIGPDQTEFTQQHSTLDFLLNLHHYASNALSTKNHVYILASDFERAFDRIGVHTVLNQL